MSKMIVFSVPKFPGVEVVIKKIRPDGTALIWISVHAESAWAGIPAEVPYQCKDDRLIILPDGVKVHDRAKDAEMLSGVRC
jgi:hypothetical protein